MYSVHYVCAYNFYAPCSFLEECILLKEHGLPVTCFLAFFDGSPIVVSSFPLGRPFLFITGGALIPETVVTVILDDWLDVAVLMGLSPLESVGGSLSMVMPLDVVGGSLSVVMPLDVVGGSSSLALSPDSISISLSSSVCNEKDHSRGNEQIEFYTSCTQSILECLGVPGQTSKYCYEYHMYVLQMLALTFICIHQCNLVTFLPPDQKIFQQIQTSLKVYIQCFTSN